MTTLFAFDFDGTLFDPHTENLPQQTLEQLERLKGSGYKVALLTARHRFPTDYLDPHFFDAYCINNGASVFLGGKRTTHHTLPYSLLEELYPDLPEDGAFLAFIGDDVYCNKPLAHQKPLSTIPPVDLSKILVRTSDSMQLQKRWQAKYPSTLMITGAPPYPNNMDIVPKDAHKYAALKEIQQFTGAQYTYAFGDSAFDRGLFEAADYNVQVGDNHALKDLAHANLACVEDIPLWIEEFLSHKIKQP